MSADDEDAAPAPAGPIARDPEELARLIARISAVAGDLPELATDPRWAALQDKIAPSEALAGKLKGFDRFITGRSPMLPRSLARIPGDGWSSWSGRHSEELTERADQLAAERAAITENTADAPTAGEVSGQLALAEATLRDTASRELDRERRDDSTFWYRRFMLSLQIGNGAAMLALMTGVMGAEQKDMMFLSALAWAPAMYFGIGLVAAGCLPGLLAGSRALRGVTLFNEGFTKRIAWAMSIIVIPMATTLAAGAFVLGLGSVVVEISQLHRATVARAAQTKAVSPPTSPTAPAATSRTPSPPPETPAQQPDRSVPPDAVSRP